MELTILCGQKMSLLVYDERKNKMVSYCSSDFTHETAVDIYQKHSVKKNKKLEAYSEKNYDYFYATQTINEAENPFLIYDNV